MLKIYRNFCFLEFFCCIFYSRLLIFLSSLSFYCCRCSFSLFSSILLSLFLALFLLLVIISFSILIILSNTYIIFLYIFYNSVILIISISLNWQNLFQYTIPTKMRRLFNIKLQRKCKGKDRSVMFINFFSLQIINYFHRSCTKFIDAFFVSKIYFQRKNIYVLCL